MSSHKIYRSHDMKYNQQKLMIFLQNGYTSKVTGQKQGREQYNTTVTRLGSTEISLEFRHHLPDCIRSILIHRFVDNH